MENLLIMLVVFLAILVLVSIIATVIFYDNLRECETKESPLCIQYICQSGDPATRADENGNTQTSDQN